MEYQKIISFLDNSSNQLSKFKTKNWTKINDQLRGVYNTKSNNRFKTSMLKSGLCDYSDAYILVKGRITVTEDAGPKPKPGAPRNAGQLFAAR